MLSFHLPGTATRTSHDVSELKFIPTPTTCYVINIITATIIQGVSGGIVNILGGGSMDYSE